MDMPDERRSAFPSFWQAVLLVALLSLANLVLAALQEIVLAVTGLDLPSWLSFLIPTASAFALVIVLGARWARVPLGEVLALRLVGGTIWPPLALAVVGFMIVLSEVDNLFRSFLPMPESLLEAFMELTQGDPLGSFVVLAVLAPVTEEPLFRGLILGGFLRRYRVGWALVGSSLLFALAHLNPWQFISTLVIGLFFGWLFWQTGSLLPPLVGHALNNGVVALSGRTLPPIPGFTGDPRGPVEFQPLWFDALGVVLVVVGLFLLHRHFRERGPAPTTAHRSG